jgi:hypothetical protein
MSEKAIVEALAAGVYEAYKECFKIKKKSGYDKLPPEEQERNRSMANHLPKLLSRVGLSLVPAHSDLPKTDLGPYIEQLAEIEHNRWLKENVAMGKRYGPEKRGNENPNMLPWRKVSVEKLQELPGRLVAAVGENNLLENELPAKVKEENKCFLEKILQHVQEVGFKIVKL